MINKAILYILSNTSAITDIVGSKIYAVIAPEETEAPAIVYSISNVDPFYSKSGHIYDISSVNIYLVSKAYSQLVTLFEAVRAALELKKGTFNGVNISLAEINNYSEGYGLESNVFYIRINMNFNNN